MISQYRLQMILTVSKIPVPDPIAPRKSANTVNKPIQIPPNVAAVIMSCFSFLQVPQFVCPFKNMPSSLSLLATSLGPCPETSIQVLLNKAQVPTMNKMQTTVWIGSLIASKRVLGDVKQQMIPPTGTSCPWAPASCQLPKILVMKDPLKFLYSICEKKYKLDTKAVWRMMGMFDVQKRRIEYGVSVEDLLLASFRLTWNPWKNMTIKNTNAVASKLLILVSQLLNRAFWIAPKRLLLKIVPQSNSMIDPSYCSLAVSPEPVLQEMGEKQLHMTVSAMLIAMNKLVPEFPIPYPLVMMSSRSIVITEAKVS